MTDPTRQALREAETTARQLRKALKRASPRKLSHKRAVPEGKGQRDPREHDEAFLSWLHELPCVACTVFGFKQHYRTEAAHLNFAIARKSWRERGGGKRIHDARCAPLCTWHHTTAPNACDNGQRKFWDRLGFGDSIADLCAALHADCPDTAAGPRTIETHAAKARLTPHTEGNPQ